VSTGLRKALVAGVVLLAIGAMLTLRLNSDKISQHFYQQLQNATDAHLSARHAELTFMHGIGLHLDTVTISHPQYQLRAKHMNISLRLLPLLLGNIQTDSLDIHDADIIIHPVSLAPTSTAISSLPVPNIRLVRSRIQTADGKTILDNLYLDMRNIGLDSKTSWELKSKQGRQTLNGTGRLHFHGGQIASGFSKLKMEHFQLTRLEAFAPHALISWLKGEGSMLSGAITLDINKHQTWALFGEVELEREHKGTTHAGKNKTDTVLKLRGKLSHPTDGALVWRDSFIHLGDQAVISIDGLCQQQDCNTRLDAKQVPLSEWAPFMPVGIAFYDHMSGMTDLNASIQWNEKQWQGNISVQLTDAHFKHGKDSIPLPTLDLQADNLGGNVSEWHTEATITSPESEGSIRIRNEQHHNGDKDLYINSHDADSELWQPLSNMLLSTLDIEPALQATGKIQGKLHLHQQAGKQSLSLDVDATQTQLAYASWLDKPENIVAQCKARLDLSDSHITAVSVQQCRLDDSSVDALNWSRHKESRKLSLNKLDLHIEQFRDLLPENMHGLSGRLLGSGNTIWKENTSWLRNMGGQWQLENIATDTWHADGNVRIQAGIFSSNQLLIDGKYGNAKLFGSFDPTRQHGDIDIIAAQLDWNQTPALADFWQQLSIQGRIYKADLKLLDNNWQNIQSFYTFSHGQLRLNKLQARLADGQFFSNQLKLKPAPEGLDIQGDMRSKNIQLQKLSRLHRWLGAAISGKLQANIQLHGRIGQHKLVDWAHSNGDILIYDGGWKRQQKPDSLTEKLGMLAPELQSYAFSKLDFRFRIGKDGTDIPIISLVHLQQPWQGSATITPDLHLTGSMRNTADQTTHRLDSVLPKMQWHSDN
jgi:hypothetical protein